MQMSKVTRISTTAADLPELEILHKLRQHRQAHHGSSAHTLVFCKRCAQLEGQLKILTDFLESPLGSERIN